MSEEKKCDHCGKNKAIGHVKTTSPTGSFSRDFNLCQPDIIDLERWIENKPNAKGQIPKLVFA